MLPLIHSLQQQHLNYIPDYVPLHIQHSTFQVLQRRIEREEEEEEEEMGLELSILHKRVPKVTRKHPEWSEPVRRILEACDRLVADLPANCDAVLHRDFYPDQVTVFEER